LTVRVYKSVHIHQIWLQIAKHSAIFSSIIIKLNLALKLLPCGWLRKDGSKVCTHIQSGQTDSFTFFWKQNRYLNKFIWLWNCSFINLSCSSLLTDEYQLHETKRFIPMMKFRSAQLILRLYSLKSQIRPRHLHNFWKVVSHAKGHQLKKWKTLFVHHLEIHSTILFTVLTLAELYEGSWCTSITQTEINHLQAASKEDQFQHIFIIDFTNFDAQKAGNLIPESLNFKIFWGNMSPDLPSKGYIPWAAYFYAGRHLLQMLLKALCSCLFLGKFWCSVL